MTGRVGMLVFVVLSAVGLLTAGAPPVSSDLHIATWENTSIVLELVVFDTGIDPSAPEVHPIEFVVQTSPDYGVVTGDLRAVVYRPPFEAVLALVYTPADGFTGLDGFRIVARDPSGDEVVVEIAIDVLARGSAGTLSGRSLIMATIDVPNAAMTSMRWLGEVRYSIFNMTVDAGFVMKRDAVDFSFDDFYVKAAHATYGLGTMTARVDFNPGQMADPFDGAELSWALGVGSTSMSTSLRSDGTIAGSRASLSFAGRSSDGVLALAARATFGACSAAFESGSVTVRVRGLPCDALAGICSLNVSGTASFSCGGFDKITVSVNGIDLPRVGLFSFAPSAGIVLSYALQTKSLTVHPEIAFPSLGCIVLGTEAVWNGTALAGIRATSLMVTCTISEGVRFQSKTSLDPMDLTLNQRVTGYLDYWEADTLSGTYSFCDGIGGDWHVGVYFARPGVGTHLLGIGMFEFKVSVACGQLWKLFTEIRLRSGAFGDPTSEWLLGADVRW